MYRTLYKVAVEQPLSRLLQAADSRHSIFTALSIKAATQLSGQQEMNAGQEVYLLSLDSYFRLLRS